MTPAIQTMLALVLVGCAVGWLVMRTLAKRKNPGCGGDCGCPTDELKAKLKH